MNSSKMKFVVVCVGTGVALAIYNDYYRDTHKYHKALKERDVASLVRSKPTEQELREVHEHLQHWKEAHDADKKRHH
eukprot:gene24783-29947_t